KLADKNFKQALEINPANIAALMPVYSNYLQANQKDVARQYLEKALQAKPNQVVLLTAKVDLDIAEKRWDDAQETVRRIALFSKNRMIPVYLQANIHQSKGQFNEAIKLYQSVIAEHPNDVNALVNIAKCYEGLNARDKSIVFFESLRKKHPDSLAVVGVLADLYVANNELAKAKVLLNQQIETDQPNSAALYMALAKVEALIRKSVEGAKEVYLKGLDVHPNNLQLSMALAGAYEQTGDIVNARRVYEKLLQSNPDFALAANNLASLLLDFGKPEDIPAAVKLVENFKDSDNLYFLDTYAWSLVKSGNVTEGIKVLESLLLKDPKVPEIRYHLGVAYLNNGNKATAMAEFKQAIALSEKLQRNFVGKEKAKQLLSELAGK
ncbi:MAG: tetratricopeptide repeat protein, partial [Methylomonas sp.]|nr:tetratricopeptide repeat protein [Methylomonas sp.]